MNSMTVKSIIEHWLKEYSFDGLFSEYECACAVGEDFMPCEGEIADCRPGYKQKCDCGDHDYHIGTGE